MLRICPHRPLSACSNQICRSAWDPMSLCKRTADVVSKGGEPEYLCALYNVGHFQLPQSCHQSFRIMIFVTLENPNKAKACVTSSSPHLTEQPLLLDYCQGSLPRRFILLEIAVLVVNFGFILRGKELFFYFWCPCCSKHLCSWVDLLSSECHKRMSDNSPS